MKSKPVLFARVSCGCIATLSLCLSLPDALAQSVWTGSTDSVFSTGTNFTPNIANTAVSNLDVRFDGSDATTTDLTLATAFGGGAGGAGSIYTVLSTQTNPLTITGSGTAATRISTGLTVEAGAGAVTLAETGNIAIGGLTTATSHAIRNLSSHLLDLGNWPVISGGGNARSLTVEAVGDIQSLGNWSNSTASFPSSNPLSLDKTGAGKLTLGGTNTFSGNTLVSAGVLELTSSLALQNSALDTSGAGTVSVVGPTTLTTGGLTGSTNLSSVITTGYSVITELTLNPRSGTQTYSGNIANGASGMNLIKSGGGTQVLSGTNTHTGATTVSAGLLKLGAAGSLGNGTSNTASLTLGGSGTLDLNGISPTATVPLTLNSSASTNDVGALENTSATAATYAGQVTLQRDTMVGTGNISLTGTITGGGFKLNKNGTSTLSLTGSGSVSLGTLQANRGTIQVNAGADLSVTAITVGSGNSVGSGLTLNGGTVTATGAIGTVLFGTATSGTASGTLQLNSGTLTVPSLQKSALAGASVVFNTNFNGGTLKANANNTDFFSGANAKVQSGGMIIDDGGYAVTINQLITEDSASKGGGFSKLGAGTLTLSASNTFAGTTSVNEGVLALAGSISLQNSVLNTDGAGTVTLNSLTALTLGGLSGNGDVSACISSGYGSLSSLTLNPDSGITASFSGGISDGAAGMNVNKSGAGTQVLSGTNTYTGATSLSAGTLRLGSAGALGNGTLNTSGVTVGGSGILDLAGIATTATVPLTLNSSASGFDVGCFYNSGAAVTFGGTVTLSANTRVGVGTIVLNNTITGNGKNLNRDGLGTLQLSNSGTVSLGFLLANRGTIQVDTGTTLDVTGISIGTGNGVGSGLTLNGGAVTSSSVSAATFASSTFAAASGTLTLNSGTLTVFGLTKGGTGVATFNANFNGGTLKATADNAAYFTGANNAKVQAGGAFIDDGGFLITIAQPLIHDTALGTTPDGGLTKSGPGTLTLSGANTYTGNTTVSAGTLELAATTGSLKFVPTSNGVTNKITGGGTLALKGVFEIDLTGAVASVGNSWTLVDVGTLVETFDASFSVAGFTESSNVWTKPDGLNVWTFKESTGVLTYMVASAFTSWIDANWPSLSDKTATGDPDNDGIDNLLEFVLNGNPSISDSSILPVVDATTDPANFIFTFTRREDSADDTTQVFQHGSDLAGWTDVSITGIPGPEVNIGTPSGGLEIITITIPKGSNTSLFGRLKVTQP